jgi:hypothetical protein
MHTNQTTAQLSTAGVIWLKLAISYLIVGVSLGIFMGATKNFVLTPVHAHINLLGWATMALAGLIYTVFPRAGESRLAKAHFWLINLSMPVMIGALSMLLLGNPGVEPVLAVSEIAAAASILCFAANIYINVGKAPVPADEVEPFAAVAGSPAR